MLGQEFELPQSLARLTLPLTIPAGRLRTHRGRCARKSGRGRCGAPPLLRRRWHPSCRCQIRARATTAECHRAIPSWRSC